jgi:hypothetical protein
MSVTRVIFDVRRRCPRESAPPTKQPEKPSHAAGHPLDPGANACRPRPDVFGCMTPRPEVGDLGFGSAQRVQLTRL